MTHRGRTTRLLAVALVAVSALVASGCDDVRRMSVTGTGAQVAGPSSVRAVSATGRYALVVSFSSLIPGESPGSVPEAYRRDNVTGKQLRVTVRSDGSPFPASASAAAVAMSADGNSVAVVANELVNPGDTVKRPTLYVRNIHDGTTTLANLAPDGSRIVVPNIAQAAFSGDGRTIAFSAGTAPGSYELYIRDLVTGTTQQLAHRNSASGGFLYSGDGQHLVIAFACLHSCFIPPEIVDLGAMTYPFPSSGTNPPFEAISDNGRYLVTGVSRYDRQTGTSVAIPGLVGPDLPAQAISGNGRFVAFNSHRTGAPGSPPVVRRPFLWDATSGAVRPLGVGQGGEPNDDVTNIPYLARNGRYVAFGSNASNLVADDTNNAQDAFIVDGAVPAPTSASPNRARGAQHVTVTVQGGFLLNTSTAEFGPGVTVESSTVGAHGAVTYVVSIAPGTAAGARDVRITTPGALRDAVGTCAGCFRVL